jgi:hypothetical protein
MKTVEAEDTPVRENCNDTKTGNSQMVRAQG